MHPTTMKGAPKRKGLTPGQRKAYKRLKAAAETSEEAQAAKVHMMLSPVEMPLIKKKRKAKPKVHTAAACRRERERHKQMCMHAPPAPTASSIASPTLTFATNTTPAEAVGPVGSTAPLDAAAQKMIEKGEDAPTQRLVLELVIHDWGGALRPRLL